MGYTSTMRYTGLSGVDTASMVDAMMQVQALKYNNLYKANVTTQYKQEAYQTVGNELVDIQSSKFDVLATDSLCKQSSYLRMDTSVKDSSGNESNAISVTTSGNSTEFNSDIEVDSLADNDSYIVTGSGAGKATATGSSDFSSITEGSTANVTVDGTTKTITFTADDVAEMNKGNAEAVDVLNNKLNESFGNGTTSKVSFGLSDDGNIQLSSTAGHSLKLSQNTSETGVDLAGALGFSSSSVSTSKTSSSTMGDMFGINGSTSLTINGGTTVTFDETTTVDDFMSQVNESGDMTVSYNQATGSFNFEGTKTGTANGLNLTATTTNELGETVTTSNTADTLSLFGSANQTSTASDAVIIVDGDTSNPITLDSNSYKLDDGTELTFNAVTDGAVNVNVEQDTEYTASMVHEFVDSYNSILESIYNETKTSRPTDENGSYYDPLTSEEKTDLSSEEIEKWEEKAKEGLLYNDSTLKGIESQLRTAVSSPVELPDGSSLYLSDLGITLNSDYSKGGMLVVDDEKLTAGIEKYGAENVAYAFANGFASDVNDTLESTVGMNGSLTQKVGLKSSPYYMTTNLMTDKINANTLRLSAEQERLEKKEEFYYDMFSRMEIAIQESNSQLSSLGLA